MSTTAAAQQQDNNTNNYETLSALYHGDTIPFTLRELKEVIPKHCFERPLTTSMLHLVSDLVQLVAYTIAYYYFSNMLQSWWFANENVVFTPVYYLMQSVLFVGYVFIEGVTFTGLWVIQVSISALHQVKQPMSVQLNHHHHDLMNVVVNE